jgi:hypothetical protein
MTDSPSSVRREIARTRERMTETIDEIESDLTDRVSAAKQKVDPMRLVREHPWSALSVAVTIGALVGVSGADEKAASATVAATKRASRATSDAVKGFAENVKERRRSSTSSSTSHKKREVDSDSRSGPGFADRLFAAAATPLTGALDRILADMCSASRQLGERLARSGRQNRDTTSTPSIHVVDRVVATPVATDMAPVPRAEDVVPVPPEMLPTELDARADAVEALGGGTHEPPLAPGAGDLGARWA